MTSANPTSTTRPPDWHLPAALIVFIGNVILCLCFFSPEVQGYGDAVKGWGQFNHLLAGDEPYFSESNQISLRLGMAVTSLIVVFGLSALGLIERRVLITYLALPFAAYLATKIKLEFIFFPFALISTRLSWKREAFVLFMICFMTIYFEENNGLVLICFRLLILGFRQIKLSSYWIVAIVGTIVIIDANISMLFSIFPKLSVYSWTRDIVNPEFSHFETAIVFASSMIIGIQPQIDYVLAFPYTLLILGLTAGPRLLSWRFYREIFNTPEFRAGFLTIMLVTSLTHVFQNARYYFYFVPGITAIGGDRINTVMILTSWPMTLGLVIFYGFTMGI